MIDRFKYRILCILGGLPLLVLLTVILWFTVFNKYKEAELGLLFIFGSLITLTLFSIPVLLTLLFFIAYRIDVSKNNKISFSLKDFLLEGVGLIIGIIVGIFGLWFLANVTVGKYAELFFSPAQIKVYTPIILAAFPSYIFLSSYFGVKFIQYLVRKSFNKLLFLILIIVIVLSPLAISAYSYLNVSKKETNVLSTFELSNFKVGDIQITNASFGGQRTEFNVSADLYSPTNLDLIIQPSINYPYLNPRISSGIGGSTKETLTKVTQGTQRITMHFGTGTICLSDDYELIKVGNPPQ